MLYTYSLMAKRAHRVPKYGMRPPEVAVAFGSRVLYDEVVRAGWLIPVISRHKLTVFNATDVARVWAKIVAGEMPKPAKQRRSESNQ